MSLVKEAFSRLFPEKVLDREASLKYSTRLSDFNANARIMPSTIVFHLSRKWKPVDDEIKIGLVQSLLCKAYKDNRKTHNIDLYNLFIRSLHISIPKTKTEPLLADSFNRVNGSYFYSLIEMPNLVWGSKSFSRLGSYNYHTDTITISSIFKEHLDLLDYIMYHEVLHKRLKFRSTGSRTFHHTTEFMTKEKEFPDAALMEERIRRLVSGRGQSQNKSSLPGAFALPRQNKSFLNRLLPRLF